MSLILHQDNFRKCLAAPLCFDAAAIIHLAPRFCCNVHLRCMVIQAVSGECHQGRRDSQKVEKVTRLRRTFNNDGQERNIATSPRTLCIRCQCRSPSGKTFVEVSNCQSYFDTLPKSISYWRTVEVGPGNKKPRGESGLNVMVKNL